MTKDQIYSELHRQGISARMIAEAMQLGQSTVSTVITNGHGSRRVAEAIAKLLDKPLTEVFPYYKASQAQHYRANQRQRQLAMLSGRLSAIA